MSLQRTRSPKVEGAHGADKRLMKQIESILERMDHSSSFFNEKPPTPLPRYAPDEIDFGDVLGRGEFGDVFEVTGFPRGDCGPCGCCRCVRDDDSTAEDSATLEVDEQQQPKVGFARHASFNDMTQIVMVPTKRSGSKLLLSEMCSSDDERSPIQLDRAYMKQHCFSSAGSSRFALKRLRSDIDGAWKVGASLDLAKEAKFLASLSHPNIIKMRATVAKPGHDDFGLVLDRMVTTLDKAIVQWKIEGKTRKFMMNLAKRWDHAKALELTRLIAMYDIARAMRYLHRNNICYRDLKPNNIGFDMRGTVKLFDFGLCKEMERDTEGFEMTGLTGSRRYMAPEVALCEDYGLSADVYSFGILFWEVAALVEPFRTHSPDKHFRDVVVKGKRPALCSVAWLHPNMRLLMIQCWRQQGTKRPSFHQIAARLCGEISTRDSGRDFKDRTTHLMDQSWSARHGSLPGITVE